MRARNAYEWLRTHPYVGDTAIVLAILLPSQIGPFASPSRLAETLPLLVELGLVVPLIWRRRNPVAVFTVVSLMCALQLVQGVRPLTTDVAFLVALYTISGYARGRSVRLAALGVGVLGSLLATIAWWWGDPRVWLTNMSADWFQALFPFFLLLALVGFAWTLGDLMRTRRAYIAELEERARRLELERDQQTRLARTAERARIARELHDVVAHSLSIVVAQADGGRYAGEHDPNAALRSLDTISTTGRDALAEMRRLLGVLRTEDSQPMRVVGPTHGAVDQDAIDWAPQPGLAEVESLVDRVRASGLQISLDLKGSGHPFPQGPGLAVYRIVQEALTNVVKHAGPAASVRVSLSHEPEALRVEVVDDGRGAAADAPRGWGQGDGRGQGIVGMRERVAVYGGTLTAEPAAGGGFEVRAVLPIPESEHS